MTSKKLFLLDAVGALITALMVGWVGVIFQDKIGLPIYVLRILGLMATGFFMNSLIAYFKNAPASYLKIVAVLNFIYCIGIIVVFGIFRQDFTPLAKIYFGGEVFLVSILANYEFKTSKKSSTQ